MYIVLIGNLLNSSLIDETVCKNKLIIEHAGESQVLPLKQMLLNV